MTTPHVDPETLAALLDGKLAPEERERVLAILASSPEDANLLLEASQVRAELGDSVLLPIRPTARPPVRWRTLVVGLAAVLLAGVGIARLSKPGLPPMISLASNLAAPAASDWTTPVWSSVRGEPGSLTERASAFRIGARLVDLEVVARAGDSAAARSIARDIAGLASGVTAGAPVAGRFERLSIDAGAWQNSGQRARAASVVADLLGESPWLDAGAWLEAARIATLSGDTRFFAETASALDDIRTRLSTAMQAGNPDLTTGLGRLAALVGAGTTDEQLRAIRAEAESLLAEGAR